MEIQNNKTLNILNLNDFEELFKSLGENYKTKDLDKLNKELIKNEVEVSFLDKEILEKQEYHRTYFQVSLGLINSVKDKIQFIENNFDKLNDWWHVDQLQQFINKDLDFDYVFEKAKEYTQDKRQFVRRWGYVIFMPTLVKSNKAIKLFELFKNNDEYYDIMAQAWLISYLAIYHPNETIEFIKSQKLEYNIIGKAIQKICDSFRISDEYKDEVKNLRKLYK